MDYMLNPAEYEFQFPYKDDHTPEIHYRYLASDDKNQVKISKKNLSTKEELPGAELIVAGKYSKNVVDHWISTGQPHYINGISPGVYLLTELHTPGEGYAAAESIEFTIEQNMTEVPYITMYDEPTKISVEKVIGTTEKRLPGAKLRLSRRDGSILDEWMTSEQTHMIYGLEPGEYYLSELEAPEGYQKGEPLLITITSTCEIQEFQYRNYRVIPSEGDIPGKIVKPPELPPSLKLGTITVSYQSQKRPGFRDWLTGQLKHLPKLGDETGGYVWGICLSALSLLILLWMRRERGREE